MGLNSGDVTRPAQPQLQQALTLARSAMFTGVGQLQEVARACRREYAGAMGHSTALVRPRPRVIAGVCGGLAHRFNVSPTRVRVLFVVSCLLPGPQVLLYVALWVILPSE